jgi:hypothetical protein
MVAVGTATPASAWPADAVLGWILYDKETTSLRGGADRRTGARFPCRWK